MQIFAITVEEVSECRVFQTLCIKHTGIEFCLVSEFWNIDSNKKVTISFCQILPRKLVCRYRCEQLEFTETFQWYSLFTKVITDTKDRYHSPPLHPNPPSPTYLILKYWCASAVALWLDRRIQLPKPLTARSNQTKKSFYQNNAAKQDCI